MKRRYIYGREELRSFGTSSIDFSAALHGLSAGLIVLLFMDELFALVEVILFILLPYNFNSSLLHLVLIMLYIYLDSLISFFFYF